MRGPFARSWVGQSRGLDGKFFRPRVQRGLDASFRCWVQMRGSDIHRDVVIGHDHIYVHALVKIEDSFDDFVRIIFDGEQIQI